DHQKNIKILDKQQTLPLISVIMPTHNRAGIINWAVNSVLEQHYPEWELLVCDDGSTDNTAGIIKSIQDPRVKYLNLQKCGAAAARNAGLKKAGGEIIAYLDSDNIWHPGYLTAMAAALLNNPGRSSAFADFIDYLVQNDDLNLLSLERPEFNHEKLLGRNYIDLNSFAHRRELYDLLGGFNEALSRRQDYDLVLKYTWLRDPVHVRTPLCLYQRNRKLDQITYSQAEDNSCVNIIDSSVAGYFASGLKSAKPWTDRITIISWDMCRNHFSKPFALAEALSRQYSVQLMAFQFFEEDIFFPLKNVQPDFETVYLPGSDFPAFFKSLDKALELITGQVIYVVKPRLPSLGLGLLANFHKKIPLVLEINDLETVVASPKTGQTHSQLDLSSMDPSYKDLATPYSDTWSRIMDPLAAKLPVLVTHNKNIDAHFQGRCLYMRNIKDESVYDPDQYNREQIRSELGFGPKDRILLFGGLLRRHKGINELVELVRRLDDPRYKLLFVGSRANPDQEELIRQHGSQVKVLPPQDRQAMARINLAADLVILWLNPDISASHYQMPYKATDAFAMKTPVIANDISDLGDLGRQGYLRLVPFGDWPGMIQTIQDIFSNESSTQRQVEAARRLYLRQFSYAAARSNMSLILNRLSPDQEVYDVSRAFAEKFQVFRDKMPSEKPREPVAEDAGQAPAQKSGAASRSSAEPGRDHKVLPCRKPDPISLIDVQELSSSPAAGRSRICVIMPSIDTQKAMKTADILARRAGTECSILVVNDTLRQGFIKTLNQAASGLSAEFIVYAAQDAYPSRNWLKCALDALDNSGKNLLAFNDGKWEGRIASFGMVRTVWARKMYQGHIFHPGYLSHKADNELTVLARAWDSLVYAPQCVLMEYDPDKDQGGSNTADTALFKKRFAACFHGLAPAEKLKTLAPEYNVHPEKIHEHVNKS
ncbi:MAG: glycosyltransferase, partial [Desulfonatronovibrionaceae bacterium]